MQQRLLENQRLAQKNTRLRSYLLRGMVHCAACGGRYVGVTVTRRGKTYSYYICAKRWKPGPNNERCQSHNLSAEAQEREVFDAVVNFLHSPEGFGTELQRRRGVTAETEVSLRRELESLQRQQKEEQDAEARAFRLAARNKVSEEVFSQEMGLIRTRQCWIEEQLERIQAQLADLERFSFSPEAIALLRKRLDARLVGTTVEDKRFVLEAVSAKVIVQADGTWELELQVPCQVPEPAGELQIVNSRPGSIYT
jgi:hypothetical protein